MINNAAAQTENSREDSLFIYRLQLTSKYNSPEAWTDKTQEIIRAHAQFLEDLGEKGILIFAGRTKFSPGDPDLWGIAVIKAATMEDAKKIMAPDPAVKAGIQQAQIYPFSMGIRHFRNLNSD